MAERDTENPCDGTAVYWCFDGNGIQHSLSQRDAQRFLDAPDGEETQEFLMGKYTALPDKADSK
jgi:hypothetical protein